MSNPKNDLQEHIAIDEKAKRSQADIGRAAAKGAGKAQAQQEQGAPRQDQAHQAKKADASKGATDTHAGGKQRK